MAKERIPRTPAMHALKRAGVRFTPRPYAYQDHGGTAAAARELGVEEHAVVKTLVFLLDGRPVLVLMHGDREVSAKALAREAGAKTAEPAPPEAAQRLTGYQVGGISPFGTRRRLPVYAQASIFGLPRVLINAGRRGLLAELDPAGLRRALEPTLVEAARP
jgi:Cys-tRNA(Pro) deacylase